MCGIIAISRRTPSRSAPHAADILALLDPLVVDFTAGDGSLVGRISSAADILEAVDALLSGVPGVTAMLRSPGLVAAVKQRLGPLEEALAEFDRHLDAAAGDAAPTEQTNAQILRLRDALWALTRDRLRAAESVSALSGPKPTDAMLLAFTSIHDALSALDRLEVRGRDSAGLHVFVSDHGLALDDGALGVALDERRNDELFRNRSVRRVGPTLSFVYKVAAEIGELGDNTAALRDVIASDDLLHAALEADSARATVLGHTRWASVGIISEANAHPLNSEVDGNRLPYVVAALNGDVDNHADLKADADLSYSAGITTDAKVIPALMAQGLATGDDEVDVFRRTVAQFLGSVAITAATSTRGDQLLLALRGSGQALYVGLAEDTFVVASEPYGLVELTSRYLRLDGETPSNPDNATASRGQIVALDGARSGLISGIRRLSYDGTELPVDGDDLVTTEITTRDIDRGGYPHFLLKEIHEAPRSFRKTVRGKVLEHTGELSVQLPSETIPDEVRKRLGRGDISRIVAIGQGTALVASEAFGAIANDALAGSDVGVSVMPATEFSGFGLRNDMSDTLVVAVSQSGTTTDTNRTVDLARGRGAAVISIVNRRNSDLTDKSDGVLYTSDGRDVEMSVASTKAFYSQVAAGVILALALAPEVPGVQPNPASRQRLLRGLRELPDAMEILIGRRASIADIARAQAPSRRYWALVGNGNNHITAREVRIKLSELCYKSIACDITEDKKHIDLSSEPLILVCAAGLRGSTADDVAKEVAIYRAHKAAPIVIADEDDNRFADALDLIRVPVVEPELAFVLAALTGHIFGYEAALAIDAQAAGLRHVRAAIEKAVSSTEELRGAAMLASLRSHISEGATDFFERVRSGAYNGHLEASTATRLGLVFRYALGVIPLDSYQLDFGKVGTPGVIIDDLEAALTAAIEELTRPIDAIKHQAKTVTVGISRSDESLLQVDFLADLIDLGAARDGLSYDTMRTLVALDPAIQEIVGYIRYRIEGDPFEDGAQIFVADRGGLAASIPSRVDRDPAFRGTKHQVALGRKVLVTQGRRDARTIVIVPEVKGRQSVGLTLAHVRLVDRLQAEVARTVMSGYGNRYAQFRDAVLETEPAFREDLLSDVPVVDLLVAPIPALADRWRSDLG